jgi:L-malate glycosyltransferase
MKILHIIHAPRFSGAEILVKNLSLEHGKKNNIAIAAINPTQNNFIGVMNELKQNGIELFIPNIKLSRLHRIFYLFKVFRKYRPDIILGHSAIVSAYMRIVGLFFKNIRKIVVLHATSDYEKNGRLQRTEFVLQYFTDCVVGVSELSSNLYIKRYHAPRVETIYNGINLHKINRVKVCREKIRKKLLNVSNNDYVILQIGRVLKVKNQILTVLALSKLPLEMIKFISVFFVGIIEDENYFTELKNVIKDKKLENNISFIEPISDIEKLLAGGDLFVMPSEREAFSIALIEALASGLPIVCSNIDGFKFIDNFHFDGIYKFDLDYINMYAKYIKNNYLEKKINIKRDVSNFGFEGCSQKYFNLFEELN